MSRFASPLFLVPLAAGCLFRGIPDEIDEEDFASTAAPVICDRLRECSRGSYESAYFGWDDCKDEQEVLLEALLEAAADVGCDFDPGGASDALHDIDDMNCQDFYENEWLASLDLIWPDCS